MDYPKTDDDWERLGECIVEKDPGISPEVLGGLTVDATATIFSWYRGELQRGKALANRQYARDRLIELGRATGCLEELDVEELRRRQTRERAEEVLERVSQPLDIEQLRPFPKTYGDWVDLAENIKERIPDDPATIATVNYQLNTIAVGESGVEEAKRWLLNKAGELGIK